MDSIINSIALIAVLVPLIGITIYFEIVKVNLKYLGIFFAIFLIYYNIIWLTPDFLYSNAGLVLHWNWPSKVFGISFGVLVATIYIKKVEGVELKSIGLTFKQNSNSITKSLVLLFILAVILNIGKTFYFPFGEIETLLYQATMPGFDEELMFRAILLFVLARAVVSSEFSLAGAKLNWACIFISVLFGLIHGLKYSNGAFGVSVFTILATGLLGFCFVWSRQLSGSIVLPIIIHNCLNVSLLFFKNS